METFIKARNFGNDLNVNQNIDQNFEIIFRLILDYFVESNKVIKNIKCK